MTVLYAAVTLQTQKGIHCCFSSCRDEFVLIHSRFSPISLTTNDILIILTMDLLMTYECLKYNLCPRRCLKIHPVPALPDYVSVSILDCIPFWRQGPYLGHLSISNCQLSAALPLSSSSSSSSQLAFLVLGTVLRTSHGFSHLIPPSTMS